MSVSRKDIAEVNGVEESVVKCENCAKLPQFPFNKECKLWYVLVFPTDFCPVWRRREE